jgi:hypothetical protein
MKMGQYVPKCRHIKFRRQGITQKREYNFHNTLYYDWLIVQRSITLVNFQLDAQNSLFIYI